MRRAGSVRCGDRHPGKCLILFALLFSLGRAVAALSEAELTALRDGFDARRDAMFAGLAGQPLSADEKAPPIRATRGLFTRDYSYSIMGFAMKAFWLGEFADEANAALLENCRFYMGNRHLRDSRVTITECVRLSMS